MNKKQYYIILGIFCAAVWLFFSVAERGLLHFVEGNRMFLYTLTYARETILDRGGVANYIGAFLTQFYYYPTSGGFVIALVFGLTALGTSKFCRSVVTLPLSFIVPGAYVVMMLDGNWQIAGLAGLCCTVWIAYLILNMPRNCGIALAVLAAYPIWHFLLKAEFFEYMVAPDAVYCCFMAATLLICVAAGLVKTKKTHNAVTFALYALIFAATALWTYEKYNPLNEEIHRYEYMVRTRNWDGILKYAEKNKPSSPLSTNAINLALEMKGRLGDEMFRYYQSGPRSLVNFEERKISSEILFLMGFVNEAQHIAFEDMAGNPNRTRGVYHITRLAEYGAVGNRNKALNEKYINTLRHTLFYRNFRPDTTLVTPDMEPCEDFFFDFSDFGSMLGRLITQRPGNRRAADYYAASLLLGKELQEFAERYGNVEPLPRHFKEAMDLVKAYNGDAPSPEMERYIRDFNNVRGNGSKLGKYAGTYWYYAHFR